jgi:hypothetical protein
MNKVIKDIWAHKTLLTRLPFIQVPAQRQESDVRVGLYMYVRVGFER